MKQTGLIKRIIKAHGLDNGAKGKFTPSMSSQRKKHSWLSPIVVACCKSKMKQQGPGGTGLESRARERNLPFT